MADLDTTIDTWLRTFTEADAATRDAAIARIWAADGTLTDPPVAASGPAELGAVCDALIAQFPGHSFHRTTAVDAHHHVFRYGWALVSPAGDVALVGTDVGVVSEDGRLQRIAGFFGELPAA
jgi:hypothetical protein